MSESFDPLRYRADFPLLSRRVHDKPLIYFDNANTAQKPQVVIDAVDDYYREYNANVARAVHTLGEQATAAYEGARDTLAGFLNAGGRDQLVLTSGTTQAINLVAYSYALPRLQSGDEILVTQMEHHANIVPWQLVAGRTGATVKAAPVDDDGVLLLDRFEALLTPKVKLAAVAHVSNVIGTVNPVAEIAKLCRARGVPLLVDGSQACPHMRVDVQAIGCDFYAFSAHKMYGPTGIGVLYAREALLAAMPPWQGGGDMIPTVSFAGSTWNHLPHRFEAGTPNIGGAVGLGAAIDYLGGIGPARIVAHEQDLLDYATARLAGLPGLNCTRPKGGMFVMLDVRRTGLAAQEFAARLLEEEGVSVLAGDAFGGAAAGHVRVSLTAPDERLAEACNRIGRLAFRLAAPAGARRASA